MRTRRILALTGMRLPRDFVTPAAAVRLSGCQLPQIRLLQLLRRQGCKAAGYGQVAPCWMDGWREGIEKERDEGGCSRVSFSSLGMYGDARE